MRALKVVALLLERETIDGEDVIAAARREPAESPIVIDEPSRTR